MFIAKYKNPTTDREAGHYLVIHQLNNYTPSFWASAFVKSIYEGKPVINPIGSFSVGVDEVVPYGPPLDDIHLIIDFYQRSQPNLAALNEASRITTTDTLLHLRLLADKIKKEKLVGPLDTTGLSSLRTAEADRDQLVRLLYPTDWCPQTGPERELTFRNDPNIRIYRDKYGSTRFVYLVNFQPAGVIQVMSHDIDLGIIAAAYVAVEVRRTGIATKLYKEATKLYKKLVYNSEVPATDPVVWKAWLASKPELQPL